MSDVLLPAGARLVHIGPHKTGSTAIQVALSEIRDQLPEHGAFYPGGPYRRRRAGWSLGLAGRPSGTEPPPIEAWERYVAEIQDAGDLRAVVSNEDFGRATADQVRRIVGDFDPERVQVVAVARRLDRYLPSQWQERVKAGDGRTFDEWLRVVLEGDESSWDFRNVWSAHDVEALVRRWTDVVDPSRFTLLVSDERDHGSIPRAFEQLLGLPAGMIQPVSDRSNRGLNVVEAEVVRQLNHVMATHNVRGPLLRRLMKEGVIEALLADGALKGPSIPLPEWALEQVRERSAQRARAVTELGVQVIGDPRNLEVPDDVAAGDPDASGAEVPLSAVTSAISATLGNALDRLDRTLPDRRGM